MLVEFITLRAVSNPLALSALLTNARAAWRCREQARRGPRVPHQERMPHWTTNASLALHIERDLTCWRASSIARKSRAARKWVRAIPRSSHGEQSRPDDPSAVMPLIPHQRFPRAGKHALQESEYFGGGSQAGVAGGAEASGAAAGLGAAWMRVSWLMSNELLRRCELVRGSVAIRWWIPRQLELAIPIPAFSTWARPETDSEP